MPNFVQLDAGGESLLVDVTVGGAVAAAGVAETVVKSAESSLDEALRVAGVVAARFRAVMDEFAIDEAELSLGLQFTAKGQVFVAQAEAQAALNITFKFIRRHKDTSDRGAG